MSLTSRIKSTSESGNYVDIVATQKGELFFDARGGKTRRVGIHVDRADLIRALREQGFYISTLAEAEKQLADRYIMIDRTEYPFGDRFDPEYHGDTIQAGSGPETAYADPRDNPNWYRNRGINYLRIAEYMEQHDARAEANRTARRNQLAATFADTITTYAECSAATRAAIDYIIDQEEIKP